MMKIEEEPSHNLLGLDPIFGGVDRRVRAWQMKQCLVGQNVKMSLVEGLKLRTLQENSTTLLRSTS